jgi:predicted dithiol-disulfide oxidoreductase (DUF899 family)
VTEHAVVPHDQWIQARKAFLAREKEFTRQRAALAADRRDLPWEAVTKEYVFDGPAGKRSLRDLFDGFSQLIVYHFMFPPEWDEGCPHCSFWADNFDGAPVHLRARDTSFAAVSRAPQAKLAAYQQRMGWSFPWFSSGETDFNYDFGASFTADEVASGEPLYNYGSAAPGLPDREGLSVFSRDEQGQVFHTYSAWARGIDAINGTYQLLDLVPKGRDEPADGFTQFWVRRHDEYGR